MSYIDNLKAIIAANVYENHRNMVTAEMVKSALNAVVDMLFPQVTEAGWHLVDEQMNIALKYDANGLDAAKVSSHFLSLIGGGGGSSSFIEVAEDGFYFVDSNYNIGAYIDEGGVHAPNIAEGGGGNLDYEIV